MTDRSAELLLDGVALRLSGRVVLEGLTFSACERRIGIVGRNGSGKTTLARLIAGLIAPSAGQITIAGKDVARDRKAALRTVGILFQNPDHQIIFPTVTEEIGFGLTQLKHSKEEVARQTRAILQRFGKGHWADAATHSLSQGQKQLVCLMAVLAMRPALIVLDEPYSGLDIPTRQQLMRYVDGVEASVVLISHDPATLQGFDRVIWLDQGTVRDDGPAARVLPVFEAQMQAWGQEDDLTHLAG
ncbi:ABC transporter ATP-binding protein [Sulfitobacter pseudonitzschiae]|uniref:ABC transporter ATP-binding protein n=1 Tax=Pseudosulfitobacter pseudonitzschiae TaxID=1402135 RepID=A0A9Q2NMJ3_9RHOB|nr:ABC transporter ATP-binding protein [Pseudosulfitobacter pseudonitzschiae]MBM2297684.1 ABC transporter ATP-binding protein [Pseudosulfitobacter pseudonitzschiae]MBM2302598.1 ABC transporter ATP-binding protein [Pseudosulfitobacter pseudonitzschiae]MBM2312412.1 ABC transporter ATP-binding protein [Pseudosulfitobacter pseudonitzschiae]MBM2317294.1 ABC transporter ATP-binding protein [Pseudosulfitobacter pseudonitzschiae]